MRINKNQPKSAECVWGERVTGASILNCTRAARSAHHRYGNVDAQVVVVGEELRDRRVEHQAIGAHDGGGDAFVTRARHCFPGQSTAITV